MSDTNSELVNAIAAGVAAALGKTGGGMQAPAAVQQTSLDVYQPSEVTVRFLKWSQFNGSAYMAGQMAGFTRAQVAPLLKVGRAEITHEFGEPVAGRRR